MKNDVRAKRSGTILRQLWSDLAWACFVAGRRLKGRILRVKTVFSRPKWPQNADGRVLIHLGCGNIASPEFINVDARPAPHVHHVCDVTDLSVFSDNCADLIYACHVLEHVRHTALKQTLWEWRRVLKPGGVLRLSVPDFDKIIHIYQSCSRDLECILGPLMGGQEHRYNIHYGAFNQTYLANKLKEVGFGDVRVWEPGKVAHHDFSDWANSGISRNGTTLPVSLNIEAVKQCSV